MTDNTRTPSAAPSRTLKTFALRDLDVAPENMRFGEPPDDEVPLLADTLLAAGLMQPVTVRPGRKAEAPAMVLDGRRRLLALRLLQARGDIADTYPVAAFVETRPGRQAAAVVLTNTAAPVHVADVICAIGKMLKARLTIAAMAAALGYGEMEVRRLAALSGLDPKALQALKAGKLSLRQAKLLARLPDPTLQAEFADAALDGFGFPEWRVTDLLDERQATRNDPRYALVGAARYAAAGGRIEADLFGERPDVLLDPHLLDSLWAARARSLVEALGWDGLTVHVTSASDPPWPEDLEPFGYDVQAGLDAAQIEAQRAAHDAAEAAAEALKAIDAWDDDADAVLIAFLQARLAAEQAEEPDRPVTDLILSPGSRRPIELQAFAPPRPAAAEPDAEARSAGDQSDPAAGTPLALAAVAPVEIEGVNHALHEVRTDAATRALIRAVAEHPPTALVALLARLFSAVVLDFGSGRCPGASTITAQAYGRPRFRVIEPLDGVVRQRLVTRRAAWKASNVTLVAWMANLPAPEQLALLADLVALTLDLREERTNLIRASARAEAAELATLCDAEVTRYWTPDAPFLRAHAKRQLVGMLQAMGEDAEGAEALNKDELVNRVAAAAAASAWAPGYLSWRPDDTEANGSDTASEAQSRPQGEPALTAAPAAGSGLEAAASAEAV